MSTQKALVATGERSARLVSDWPIPALRPDYILVKTVAVALNPTDWKHMDGLAAPGALIGCDYAGTVEEVGKEVRKPFRKGDRVYGIAHGGNAVHLEDGAFAEYITVKGDIQAKLPNNLGFQEAATFGVGITTVGQSLYQSLKLALPTDPVRQPVPVLIYGGSTATGTLAIQFAKLSGYTVLTTCSPRMFDLARSRGADAVFDYTLPGSATAIREYSKNNLQLVLDTIATDASARYCGEAISSEGGVYTALSDASIPRDNVSNRWTLAYTALGEAFMFGPIPFPAKPENGEFIERFWSMAEGLVAEGKVQPHPPRIWPGGLKGALDGLKLMREGRVSGEKLVCCVADTP